MSTSAPPTTAGPASTAILAVALELAGRRADADAAIERARQRVAQLAFPQGPFSEAIVHVYVAYVYRLRGDADRAKAAADRIAALGERHGFGEHVLVGTVLGVAATAMTGDETARRILEASLAMWQSTGGGLAVPVLLAELAATCFDAGEHERAAAAVEQADAEARRSGQAGAMPEVLRLRARLAGDDAAGLVAAAELAIAEALGARWPTPAPGVPGRRRPGGGAPGRPDDGRCELRRDGRISASA